jgi:hypothetical protein
MERKNLEVPIKDFDDNGYDDSQYVLPESDIENPKELDLSIATGSQLLDYFLKRFKEAHGYDYVVDKEYDRSTFDLFRDRYGTDAGHMVRILFDNHNGKLSATDGVITVKAFARGAKWLQDMLYFDLQEEKKKQILDNSVEGLMAADDFIRRFRLAQ